MQQVIMAIHLMVVVALVALVLYQKSEGGALGIGQSGLFSGRGQANALTRATSILGAIFFMTSILLTVLPAWERRAAGGADWTTAIDQKLEIKEIKPPAANAPEAAKDQPADGKESIFEQLKRAQEQRRTAAPKSEAAPPAPAGEAEGSAMRPSTEAAPQSPAPPAEQQPKN